MLLCVRPGGVSEHDTQKRIKALKIPPRHGGRNPGQLHREQLRGERFMDQEEGSGRPGGLLQPCLAGKSRV